MKNMINKKPVAKTLSVIAFATLIFGVVSFGPMFFGPGLTTPEPIGMYLNGAFPATPFSDDPYAVAFDNMTFDSPLTFTPVPGQDKIILGQRDGKIYWFNDDQGTTGKNLLLDLSNEVGVVWDGGFLGLAIHPQFGTSGKNFFYVYYTTRSSDTFLDDPKSFSCGLERFHGNYLHLERFEVNPVNLSFVSGSRVTMIKMQMYNSTHRGGGMDFGNDGFLYVSTGDQAAYINSQIISDNLDGGVLRLDVDKDPSKSHAPIRKMPDDAGESDEFSGVEYWIPNDNPFLGGSNFEEYYSIGLRNPHRMTKDTETGIFYIGDVGETTHEEINVLSWGKNYGWPVYEGTGVPNTICVSELYDNMPHEEPLTEFSRSEANALIGGYVYRGTEIPELYGKYICADWGTGEEIWSVDTETGNYSLLGNFTPERNIMSFGQDAAGEIYILKQGDGVNLFKLTTSAIDYSGIPQNLSDTGAFQDLSTLSVTDGLIPFELIDSFWSDGAQKKRWMAIPNDGSHDTAAEKINYSENGVWDLPVGTVLVKHFDYPIDDTDPSVTKKIETRFTIKDQDGRFYYLTYNWNDQETDATLQEVGMDESITIATQGGGTRQEVWHYPSNTECISCHNSVSNGSLGLRTRNLNSDYTYDKTGLTGNQLVTLSYLGILDQTITDSETPTFLTRKSIDDLNASIDEKARSYMDLNCAYCHRPETGNRADFDLRFINTLEETGLLTAGTNEPLGIPDEKIVVAGDASKSILYHRANSVDPSIMMPPLAKGIVDVQGVALIEAWINQLSNQLPVITLNGANPQEIELGTGYTELGATTDDDSTVVIDATEFEDTVGTYTIYYDANDGINDAQQVTRTVNVVDTTAPTAICQDIIVDFDENGQANFTAEQVDNGSNDSSGIASLELSQTSFGCNDIDGVNEVTLTVTDNNGNSSSCTATVTVRDVSGPSLDCGVDIVQNSLSGQPLSLEIVPPLVVDNCDVSPSLSGLATFPDTSTLVLDNQTGQYTFPVGTTTIVWTSMDAQNNQRTCQQTVTVNFTASTDSSIATFNVSGQVSTTIVATNIQVVMPLGTDLNNNLSPVIEISEFASVSPASGESVDFSVGPVDYTVTAQDGLSQTVYTVSVELETDTTTPMLVSTDPLDDAIDVTVDAVLSATFDEPIQWAGGGTIIIQDLTDDIPLGTLNESSTSITFNGSTLSIDPMINFTEGHEYEIQISGTSLQDAAGNLFTGIPANGWTFTTALAANPFITTWKTDNPGDSNDNQITIPTFGAETYDYSVDWGDGSLDTGVSGNITHTYSAPGTYTVLISGDFPRIYFQLSGDNEKILAVDQWGDVEWKSMQQAFMNCTNMDVLAVDVPNLSQVSTMESMFNGCVSLIGNPTFDSWNVENVTEMFGVFARSTFNQPIANWNVSNVTDMTSMFFENSTFNQNIANWNVINCNRMVGMFAGASSFNQPIGNWNVSNVTNMNSMFEGASQFNLPIGNWNVSNVTDMALMFSGASSFNQDISGWNMSDVTEMNFMFFNASSFNQPIGNWDVSSVTAMISTFFGASSFNQSLENWDVSEVNSMQNIFSGSGLNNNNYDQILRGWSQLPTLQNGVQLDALQNQYCLAREARQSIIDTFGWTINDGGSETELPIAVCQDITVQLNSEGITTITAADIDNGSTDNCGIASLEVSPSGFTGGDIGSNAVTLTVTDVNGNTASCNAQVTVTEPTIGTIWFEDFEDQVNGTVVDNGATAWSSSRNGGLFEVLDGRFWTNGAGALGTWTSEAIPIGGTISISMDVDDSDDRKETADFLRALYIIDGGTPVEFGFVSNDIEPQTFTSGNLSGSTLQIVVESQVSASPENYYIDNITVTGATTGGTTYELTVNSGSGDGVYAAGQVVNIVADAAPPGQQFEAWTGDISAVGSVGSASTTVTMPASDVSITATYGTVGGTTYELTVNSGSGDGSYAAGQVVNIVADTAPPGQQFEAWTGDISAVGSVSSASTTVTMPTSDVSITATYGTVAPGGTIWFEDFEDQVNGTVVDNGATAWSSSRNGGLFEVLDGRFWTNGAGALGTWTSEAIPIGGTISISMDVDDSDDRKEAADFLRALYIIDGGTPVEFGFVSNDIEPQTFTSGNLSGSTLQIVVESQVSASPENYYIDNITVTGATTGGTTYELTVNSGSGDGVYAAGQVVNIVADAAPPGQQFEAWTGDISAVGSVGSASTTVTMPTSDVSITATYGTVAPGGTIWFEDFEDQVNGTVVDNGATAWSSSRNGGSFEVLDGRFWTNGAGALGTWTSEAIPIGGTISISMDVDDSDDRKETADFLRALYIIDGGTPVEFGFVSNDIEPQTFTSGNLSGSTLQIVVESQVSASPENYYIDNITVTTSVLGLTARIDNYAEETTGSGKQIVPFALTPLVPNKMTIIPNPATIEVSANFESPAEVKQIMVFDVTGRLVKVYEAKEIKRGNGYQMGVYSLESGTYFVKTVDSKGTYFLKQMVIKR